MHGADAQFQHPTGLGPEGGRFRLQGDGHPVDPRILALKGAGQKIHAGTSDKIADEFVPGIFEKLLRCADLNDFTFVHEDHLIREGQGFHLVVGDIDHRQFELFVDLLELAP